MSHDTGGGIEIDTINSINNNDMLLLLVTRLTAATPTDIIPSQAIDTATVDTTPTVIVT